MVESIKPNRLKINLELKDNVIDGGRSVPMGVSSNWLTGPPASGLSASVSMTLRSGSSTFKGFEGYSFSCPLSDFTTSEHQLFSTRLDFNGQANVNVSMPTANYAPGMLRADILTTVEEQGGDVSFNTMTVPFSPYSAYVGVRLPREDKGMYLETDKDYKVEMAAPGMTKDDFKVNVDENNNLTICMEKKEEKKEEKKDKKYLRREFSYSKFQQTILLPENVEKDKISAKVEHGILSIEIPKVKEEEKQKTSKAIEVK